MTSVLEQLGVVWRTFVDWHVFAEVLPKFITQGLPNTIRLTVYSAVIGTIVGLVLAIAMTSGRVAFRFPAGAYTNVMRALPAMLSIYVIGQGLPLSGLKVFGNNTYGYAALAVGLMESAYLAEIFRSGMQSVDRSYIESAQSLGLSRWKTTRKIVIPIGFRRIIPALTNQYVLIIKATSMVYLLGLAIDQRDLFSMAKDEVGTRATLAPLVAAGAVYLLITLPCMWLVNRIDVRLRNGADASRNRVVRRTGNVPVRAAAEA
ncbi:amino acid ABC transporter permease [Schaalia naturae]|jgi:His/Glu/Gln/Arg/opine family amino acid ABC transporter permease subunit|uniref:Amino acid ABC transporter permease n=1 Tax=Schaalia naturae TaxID=635203 RepID=A0ABW2SLK2_9ACTO